MTGSRVSGYVADESRSKYWIYLSNYPCHHDLPSYAEEEALTMLQLMIVRKHISQDHIDATLFLDQRILPTRKAWPTHHSRCQTSSNTSISLTFPKHSRLPIMMCPVPKVISSATLLPIFVRHSLQSPLLGFTLPQMNVDFKIPDPLNMMMPTQFFG